MERNIGVVVDSSMKVSTQHATVVKKGNSKLEFLRKVTENKTANIIMSLYGSKVLPCSENCKHISSLYFKKYIAGLKKVQKGAIK